MGSSLLEAITIVIVGGRSETCCFSYRMGGIVAPEQTIPPLLWLDDLIVSLLTSLPTSLRADFVGV